MRAFGFDTETTDLIRSRARPLDKQPHVTEFFGLGLERKGKRWSEAFTFSSLFNPGIPLSPEVQRITGLNDLMLKNEPGFAKHALKIKELIEGSDIVFAHNLGFDRGMLDIEMARLGMKIEWPKRLVCTVEITEHLKGRRLKLIELCRELFGEDFEGAHRAENDVRPMVRCFIELDKRGLV